MGSRVRKFNFDTLFSQNSYRTAAKKYSTTASNTTRVKPKWIAITVASTALITDAQPSIAHADGISFSARSSRRVTPSGNGMPIGIASSPINAIDTASFTDIGAPISGSKTKSGSTSTYKSPRIPITMTYVITNRRPPRLVRQRPAM